MLWLLLACNADRDADGFPKAVDCDDRDPRVGGPLAYFVDGDGDGYGDAATEACELGGGVVAEGGDCDDGDADVHPSATEICDGVDNDCDGDTDVEGVQGAPLWRLDADGDGYGRQDTIEAETACTAPDRHVADASDCDDGDPDVHPGADELCDEVDNDCDGELDEDDATDAPIFYTDADGDGYGDPKAPVAACSQPSGAVDDATDCDDALYFTHPDADEHCDDRDNDCDGSVDEDALDAWTWYLDADGDGWGDEESVAQDCDQPSGYVEEPLDCDDGDAAVAPDLDEICSNGVDDDCDGGANDCGVWGLHDVEADAAVVLRGLAEVDGLGQALAAGDLDGDGGIDLVAGAPGADAAYVVSGTSLGELDADAAWAELVGTGGTEAGAALWAGELTGDVTVDLSVGAWADDGGAIHVESVGAGTSTLGSLTLGDLDAAMAGYALGGGDLTGDGQADLLVGAPGYSVGGDATGAAFVVAGPVTGGDLEDGVGIEGTTDGSQVGTAVAVVPDFDGDGVDELLVGGPGWGTNTGRAWMLLGGTLSDGDVSDADATFQGESSGGETGASVAGAGDVDGDGYGDVLIGAPGTSSHAGRAYFVRGPNTGNLDLGSATSIFSSADTAASSGSAVAGLGDVDGDGYDDVAIGSAGLGDVHVMFGPVSGTIQLAFSNGTATGAALGEAVLGAGDVDGDGYDDLWLGAPEDDTSATDAGSAYLLLGGGL